MLEDAVPTALIDRHTLQNLIEQSLGPSLEVTLEVTPEPPSEAPGNGRATPLRIGLAITVTLVLLFAWLVTLK
jgi:hypothetical protein